jgi:hypothetical protein
MPSHCSLLCSPPSAARHHLEHAIETQEVELEERVEMIANFEQ